jgi:hypothetical protein
MASWWKPYDGRGTPAWSHRVLEPSGWAEAEALQCHTVHWLTEGKGAVFKAGAGALTGAGHLGEKRFAVVFIDTTNNSLLTALDDALPDCNNRAA